MQLDAVSWLFVESCPNFSWNTGQTVDTSDNRHIEIDSWNDPRPRKKENCLCNQGCWRLVWQTCHPPPSLVLFGSLLLLAWISENTPWKNWVQWLRKRGEYSTVWVVMKPTLWNKSLEQQNKKANDVVKWCCPADLFRSLRFQKYWSSAFSSI